MFVPFKELFSKDKSNQDHSHAFAGGSAAVTAFSDPKTLPPDVALAVIDSIISTRPDATELKETLAARIIKEKGIPAEGTGIEDHYAKEPHDPNVNPHKLYVSPYPRPTAGSLIMPVYQDDQGDFHVLLVRNWKNPRNHALGVEDDWRFSGGFMKPYVPDDTKYTIADHNLYVTAQRELEEETGLKVDINLFDQMLVTSDAELHTTAHPINAYFLADLGRRSEAPPVQARDDVADATWVNVRDITHRSGQPPLYVVNARGQQRPLRQTHAQALEIGLQKVREKEFPLHDPAQCQCCHDAPSQVTSDMHKHYGDIAFAHGLGDVTINIHLDQFSRNNKSPQKGDRSASWQEKIAAETDGQERETPVTLH